MNTKPQGRRWPLYLLCLACCVATTACQGPDPLRVRAERASYQLAQRCADGWFHSLPFTAEDDRLVRQSLADWDRRLQADEALVGPIGGGK